MVGVWRIQQERNKKKDNKQNRNININLIYIGKTSQQQVKKKVKKKKKKDLLIQLDESSKMLNFKTLGQLLPLPSLARATALLLQPHGRAYVIHAREFGLLSHSLSLSLSLKSSKKITIPSKSG